MIMKAIRRILGGDDDQGMGCREALERVYDFMDGEIDPDEAARVEEHFQLCARCYPHLKLEECFRRRMREAVSRPEVPGGLRDRCIGTRGPLSCEPTPLGLTSDSRCAVGTRSPGGLDLELSRLLSNLGETA